MATANNNDSLTSSELLGAILADELQVISKENDEIRNFNGV